MKKFLSILPLWLSVAILFAIGLQSSDGIGHLHAQFYEKQCRHHYHVGKNEINHGHHQFEKCFVCEFTFSQFLSSDIFTFSQRPLTIHSGYVVARSREITQFFRGSLFSLRGPPQHMV